MALGANYAAQVYRVFDLPSLNGLRDLALYKVQIEKYFLGATVKFTDVISDVVSKAWLERYLTTLSTRHPNKTSFMTFRNTHKNIYIFIQGLVHFV